jgi:hypothetical protein
MRYSIIILFLAFLSISAKTQVTIFPEVDTQSEDNIYIKKVELTDQFTIIDFYFRPMGEAWICAENSFHITPYGTTDIMFMMMAKNISMCPKMQKIGTLTPYLEFQIWFPPLREKVYKINVIEKAKRGTNFYGVDIINGQEKPLPDSSKLRSQEEFENYFTEHSDSLDPIEGIWQVNINLDLFEHTTLIDRNYDKSDSYIAIIKTGEKFVSFDLNGRNLEAEYKWITGGRGYYYQEYYRELNDYVSTYIKATSTIQFEINYEVPDRMARLILMNDYFPQYRLMMLAVSKKQYPATEENPVDFP